MAGERVTSVREQDRASPLYSRKRVLELAYGGYADRVRGGRRQCRGAGAALNLSSSRRCSLQHRQHLGILQQSQVVAQRVAARSQACLRVVALEWLGEARVHPVARDERGDL